MKFTVQKPNLINYLRSMQNVIKQKTTLPILNNVKLATTDDGIILSGTDLELAAKDICPAEIQQQGETTIPAKRLLDITKQLPDDNIQFTLTDDFLQLKCGKSKFKLRTLPFEDFPTLPELNKNVPSFTLLANDLQPMLKRAAICTSNDETRYTLTGMLIEIKNNTMTFCSTDGHRLALCTHKLNHDIPNCYSILPKTAIYEMQRLVDANNDLSVSFTEDMMYIEIANNPDSDYRMVSKLIQGKFPDYKAVFPDKVEKSIVLDASELASAIKRVSILCADKSHGIMLSFKPNEIMITSSNAGIGDAEESIISNYTGERFDLNFNWKYLMDYLAVTDGPIKLDFGPDMRPCCITQVGNDKFTYLVMPLRN